MKKYAVELKIKCILKAENHQEARKKLAIWSESVPKCVEKVTFLNVTSNELYLDSHTGKLELVDE